MHKIARNGEEQAKAGAKRSTAVFGTRGEKWPTRKGGGDKRPCWSAKLFEWRFTEFAGQIKRRNDECETLCRKNEDQLLAIVRTRQHHDEEKTRGGAALFTALSADDRKVNAVRQNQLPL